MAVVQFLALFLAITPSYAGTPDRIHELASAGKCDKAREILAAYSVENGPPDFNSREWRGAYDGMVRCDAESQNWQGLATLPLRDPKDATSYALIWRYSYATYGPDSPREVLSVQGRWSNQYVALDWTAQRWKLMEGHEDDLRAIIVQCLEGMISPRQPDTVRGCISKAPLPEDVVRAEAVAAAAEERRSEAARQELEAKLDQVANGEAEGGRCQDDRLQSLQENQNIAELVFKSMSMPFILDWSRPLVIGSALAAGSLETADSGRYHIFVVGYRPVKFLEVTSEGIRQLTRDDIYAEIATQAWGLYSDGFNVQVNQGDTISFRIEGRGCAYVSLYREY